MLKDQNRIIIFKFFWILFLLCFSSLLNAGSISGQVTDISGKPILNAYISLYTWDGKALKPYYDLSTDENGKYYLSDIENGEYYLEFGDFSGPYLEQAYATGIPLEENCMAYQKPVIITADKNLSELNTQLSLGGSISGRVTDSAGIGIPNVYVFINSWDGQSFRRHPSVPGTDSDGYYTAVGLAGGDYYLQFDKDDSPYLSLGYQSEMPFEYGTIDNKTAITLQPGQVISNIDVQLTLAGSISGRVTNAEGVGIAGVYVFADTWNGSFFDRQSSIPLTDANGYYTVPGLSNGDYYLHFEKEESIYLSQGYTNEIPFTYGNIDYKTAIRIRSGQNFKNIDIQLTLAGSISGRVTDTDGHGISGVYVFADTWNGSFFDRQSSIPLTDANGYYTVPGLSSGDYYLHFEEQESSEYFSLGYPAEVPFEYGSIENKTGIRITTGLLISNLNVQLIKGQDPSNPLSRPISSLTPLPAQPPSATVKSITGTLITVTPDTVQLNQTGDTPKVQNVLVMLTDQESAVTIERESKVEIEMQEKTIAVFHPTANSESISEKQNNEPVTLIRGTIASNITCSNYEVRTSLATMVTLNSCSCFRNISRKQRAASGQTKFTTSYEQSGLNASLKVIVNTGTVDIIDKDGNTVTLTAGEEKVINNRVPHTAWVLPIDGDKIYGDKDNLFIWTEYPDAKSYLMEYNFPSPVFAEDNAASTEYPKQSIPLPASTYSKYDGLILFTLPLPKGAHGVLLEVRIFALDAAGNIIGESASSDRSTITIAD
ncbi:MAG: carboxypeptidase-like regulatory domain-containing protein [gamma proteobacterium symbiont of Taylorina sp.]|nr:carboxypeptidase-like regulatory domain-containing protein [gamma proteobacterium symbiont of Taylorina sp.]